MGRIIKKELVFGYWQCEYCGSEISGKYSRCLNCGASAPKPQKGQKSIFYLKPNSQPITDPTELASKNAGPNWLCSHCGSDNSDFLRVCNSCNNPRDASDQKRASIRYGEGEQAPSSHQETFQPAEVAKDAYESNSNFTQTDPYVSGNLQPGSEAVVTPPSLSGRRRSGKPFGLSRRKSMVPAIVLFVFAAFVIYVVFIRHTYANVEVASFSWQRAIQIEKLVTLTEEDWSVPSGGREQYSESKIHHYEQVLDHYETRPVTKSRQVYDGEETWQETVDNGDGTFSVETRSRPRYRSETYTDYEDFPVYRDEPVHQTWYTYEIDRWQEDRVKQSRGDDQSPYWSEYSLAVKERVGFREQQYTIKLNSTEDDEIQGYIYELPEDKWTAMQKGQIMVAKVNFFNKIVELAPPDQP